MSQTQTQTQNSITVECSQQISIVPTWGRLYSTIVSINKKPSWNKESQHYKEYHDLTGAQFTVGRALDCSIVMSKELIGEDIIKNISKQHFIIKRDMSEPLSPAIITDTSYNGTFVNGIKIGKGNSRVLDDDDEIGVSHPLVKLFIFKYELKNEQDQVPESVSRKYYISRTLGQGACGIVKLVYNKVTCTKFAMKIIKKCRHTTAAQVTSLNLPEKIMNEIKILSAINHPNIVSTEEVFDSQEAVYIVLELMEGGELFDKILQQGRLTEQQTKFLFRQMVMAVKYLHSQGITHRDLKPENVLLGSKEEETVVKISDFGLSKFVGEDTFMKTMCGTPLYVAPEIFRGNGLRTYGPEVDVWSLGVILFVCLVGYLPFSHEYSGATLQEQILSGRFRYAPTQWRAVSAPAHQLVRRMLTVRADRRITLDQILLHSWMQDEDVIIRVETLLGQVKTMKSFDQLTLSSTSSAASSDENSGANGTSLKQKRALSNTSSSCEPLPKKFKAAFYPEIAEENNDVMVTKTCAKVERFVNIQPV